MSEMLAFEGVSLVLGGARVLDRIDLHIGAGERVAIVGESGAGKGWLLRLAVGLAEPGSGMVRLMGVALDEADTDQRRLLRARCGLAMQGGSLLGDLTVEENMRLALGRMGGRDARARRRIDRLLLEYGLEQAADIRADMLSIGERRRAELARAFMRDPDLVILDEPFEGAYARGAALEEQVRRRTVPHGRALLLLTQDAALAERLCERVYRLEAGRLI
ncbi:MULTISPECIES: ATP-binding cassette domain-containing protein [Sphingobium]|uniref:ABC transport system ATP-binding protein n=1 Tax=Sphingobium xenophagum TaxID=121428 RepID=A0A401J5F9_SPHXE|nr:MULTISPECIES: ATP-binding cassette domain-containing protein [Sphingobium]MBG6117824.1 ABC-type multidrug transport system ATPase subunit [Sphingobium sp. JAI105]PSO12339.1 ABC transporter ATP-binding protein [Sphingobium sp. AEW4]TWD08467.1 putative ABC transport system ATP-binding protein/phosphonate transport system ATP-binding protein/D-methionine transport system ATP-binding protein/sodium transport system ATP-binding protein [Sphingobium sp. AEW010]TWD25902.1 putative ABC transport sys